MKKLIVVIMMALSMIVSGCSVGNNSNQPVDTTPVETVTETSAEISETTAATKSVKPTETTTEVYETEKPTVESEANNNDISVASIEVPTGFDYIRIMDGIWKNNYIWNFDNDIAVGTVPLKNLQNSSIKILDWEGFYGLKAITDGSAIKVMAYNHSKKDHSIGSTYIKYSNGNERNCSINYDSYTSVDASNAANGLYAFVAEFDTMDIPLYFYVNDGIPYCVRLTESARNITRYETVNNFIENHNYTPDMALDVDGIDYPTWNNGTDHRRDTDRWKQLSHDLLDEFPDWSDEMKVLRITDWMLNNIKYDDWRVSNGSSRAKTYNVWDGTYSMWDIKAGVCCDFVNVMAIMLREQGIPTSCLSNKGHTWTIVYLDGMWHEIDITDMMPYHTYKKDASDTSNSKTYYNEYMMGYKTSDILYLNSDIYDQAWWASR